MRISIVAHRSSRFGSDRRTLCLFDGKTQSREDVMLYQRRYYNLSQSIWMSFFRVSQNICLLSPAGIILPYQSPSPAAPLLLSQIVSNLNGCSKSVATSRCRLPLWFCRYYFRVRNTLPSNYPLQICHRSAFRPFPSYFAIYQVREV